MPDRAGLNGQWIGKLDGEDGGVVILDLDERTDRYTGTALFIPSDKALPHTAAAIDTGQKGDNLEFAAPIFPVHPGERRAMSMAELTQLFPGVDHAGAAQITLQRDGEYAVATYRTPITQAQGTLTRYGTDPQSHYKADREYTWADFKALVDSMNVFDFVWRGQAAPWALRSSFHRSGRVDLSRYVADDMKRLQAELVPYTTSFVEITSPARTSGLYNLAQHHGFPTPVLDWTYSPYVAAFFALRRQPEMPNAKPAPARIFAFNQSAWPNADSDLTSVTLMPPHVTLMNLPPLENQRASAQQAVAMVTNVADIELYINAREQELGRELLISIDIPWAERPRAMRDLRVMGITAASMFPGLDGVCEEMKQRLFDED